MPEHWSPADSHKERIAWVILECLGRNSYRVLGRKFPEFSLDILPRYTVNGYYGISCTYWNWCQKYWKVGQQLVSSQMLFCIWLNLGLSQILYVTYNMWYYRSYASCANSNCHMVIQCTTDALRPLWLMSKWLFWPVCKNLFARCQV